MKTIITDDAGVAAAQAACKLTSEVTEIDLAKTEALIIKTPSGLEPWDEQKLVKQVANVLGRATALSGNRITVFVIPSNMDMSNCDEKQMRDAGWVKAKKP